MPLTSAVRASIERRFGAAHARVGVNMLVVALFVGVAKLAGAAKEAAVAWRYGTDEIVDAYLFAFTLVLWLPTVWGSINSHVFVPLAHRLDPAQRRLFNGEFLALLITVGTALAVSALALSPWLVSLLGRHSTPTASAAMGVLVPGLAPLLLIVLVLAQLNAQLLAEERHANTVLDALPSLGLLATLLAWPGPAGVQPLLWGTLAGFTLQLVAVTALAGRSKHFSPPRFGRASSGWVGLPSTLGTVAASQLIVSTVPIIDQLLAARLGPGGIATLGYASRLLALFLALGATAIGRAILPVLSAEPGSEARLSLALRWSALLFALGLGVVVVGWFGAEAGVRLVFERGAFDAADTVRVATTVRHGLAQVPFFFAGIVLVQLFASERAYRVLLGSSIVAVALKLGAGWALSRTLGVPGVALSSGVMYLGTFVWLAGCAYARIAARRR